MIPLLVLAFAGGAWAADPALGLPEIRGIAAVEIRVPRIAIELPGEQYRCWTLRLTSPRGHSIRGALEELRALRDRLRERLSAIEPGSAPPPELSSLGLTFLEKKATYLRKGIVREQPRRTLFGLEVAPHRVYGDLDGEDYELRPLSGVPDCPEGAPPP